MSPRARLLTWLALLLGGAGIAIWLDLKLFPELFKNPYWHAVSFALGLLLFFAVVRAASVAGRTLSRYGREGEIPRLTTNRLVKQGPYACMRHPMHFALLFFPLALGLLIGSPSFVLFVWPAEVALMLYLIKTIEEADALRAFGEEYRRYMEEVPAFNLHPECLVKLFREEISD